MRSITFLFLLAISFGCLNEPECLRNSRQSMTVVLRDAETGTQTSFDFTEITALQTDSIFYTNQSLSSLQLPLNTGKNETTFIFKRTTRTDTLIATYDVSVLFISEDCGLEILMKDLQFSRSTFDSVAILNSDLTQTSESDIEIYY